MTRLYMRAGRGESVWAVSEIRNAGTTQSRQFTMEELALRHLAIYQHRASKS